MYPIFLYYLFSLSIENYVDLEQFKHALSITTNFFPKEEVNLDNKLKISTLENRKMGEKKC